MPNAGSPQNSRTRLRVLIHGAVQGVGFRPFVFRLAQQLSLKGWVSNSTQGVSIEVEGTPAVLRDFLLRLEREKPPRSSIYSLESSWLDPKGFDQFQIRQSAGGGERTALVLPDIATCADCRREIFDPANRRYLYPFTNCTNCGPRFSIIEALPYDRPNTSMKGFVMCPECRAEYENPLDRRFHAQPNACPVCGPHLEFWDADGNPGSGADDSVLNAAAEAIRAGKIVAVKGLGGFHLVVRADDDAAVRRLRDRKHREQKPLAVMFPRLNDVRQVCRVSDLEERLLLSPEAPIVLLERLGPDPGAREIAPSIAPANPNLGVMLPYTPLHHLLLSSLRFPVVATSGNLSDEPICIEEREAVQRLAGIADAFLVHNRPIVRHVDDSVARVMAGREMVLRRARGFAPLPVHSGPERTGETPVLQLERHEGSVLAVGAHLKNAVALSRKGQVFISQHIGDLETEQAYEAFRRVIRDFQALYAISPAVIAADAHPDYLSSRFAREKTVPNGGTHAPPIHLVQHHLAHVFSCMAENELRPPVLGVAWDGTGFGLDGTIWGGEFFKVEAKAWQRFAHLRPFGLPGGDQAVKEPRRSALGLLYAAFGEAAFGENLITQHFSSTELKSLRVMLGRKVNSPLTSSIGRLFDAISSLAGLRHEVAFEGQAAMELEFALPADPIADSYPVKVRQPAQPNSPLILDWEPLLKGVLVDLRSGVARAQISSKFHNSLSEAIVNVAQSAGFERVALSGGCFQNRYLLEKTISRLEQEKFRVFWHQRVPPNDGGIALGQVAAVLSKIPQEKNSRR